MYLEVFSWFYLLLCEICFYLMTYMHLLYDLILSLHLQ